MIPSHVFREYDIRGIADTEFTDGFVTSLGRAFAALMLAENKTKISVGHDMRPSSERLKKALLAGLTSGGLDVVDLGLVPTPVLYFSVSHLKLDAGICITGSHNPVEYNGFKMHLAQRPFFGAEIQKMREIIERGAYSSGQGRVTKASIIPEYQDCVQSIFKFKRRLKVVVDSGHGMGGVVAPELIRRLGHEVIELYSNLDPAFPDHHPDPSEPHNLEDVRKKVLETGADFGIAFDGDADRIGVVDEKGGILPGDKILLLCARAILKKKPGATIIGDVKCSQTVYEDIQKRGGNPVMWKTGHSLIKAKMKETHAELAGEMSGHIFFVDRWFGFDDAIYGACRVLEIADEDARPLSQHLADLPELFSTPEIRVDCPDQVKFALVKKAVEHFKKTHRVIDTDGARILFDGGWGLVRASNTQPVLVMRFEAQSEEKLLAIRSLVEKTIQELSGAVSA
ncbi:MAG: phosphomannomutase/phosphoglucomutase [Candidatus Omnitrophica bacterium]|nr:phosphomannomutase/phosphoglucomutase [Candidatus Omnitrophota bacterium]